MRLTIGNKLVLGFVGLTILVVAFGIYGLNATKQITAAFEGGEENLRSITSAATEASIDAKRAEGYLMLLLTLHDEADREQFFGQHTSLLAEIDTLDERVKSAEGREILDGIRLGADELLSAGSALLSAYDADMAATGDFDLENHEGLVMALHDAASATGQYGVELADFNIQLEAETRQTAQQNAISIQQDILIFMLVTVIAGMCLAYFISRSILNPVTKLREAAIEIGRGNLNKRAEVTTRDEIGELANSFNQMTDEIQRRNQELETEITEREQIEQTLKQSEARYRALVEEINDGFSIADDKGVITFANKAMAQILGFSHPKELIGRPFIEFVAPELKGEEVKAFANAIMSKDMPPSVESSFTRKDGTKGFIELKPTLIIENGRVLGTRAVIRDVTERKRAEQEIHAKNEKLSTQNEELRAAEEELRNTNEELQSANEELRETQEQLVRSEKLAAIGQLAGGVGHELRNPLGALKNAAYYIRGKLAKNRLAKEETRVMEFLDIMDEEIAISSKILNDLLNFSRTGKPAVSATRIEPLIDSTLSRLAIPDDIAVTKKLEADLPQVEIDPDQIRQVLVNLITNAVQAMPEGGRLTVSARGRGKALEVTITDTGTGIPQKVVSKIFDPLFTTKAKGIGLGLAVTKSIIENHKGSIGVSSKVGRGTTFTIELPLNTAKAKGE